MNKQQRREWRVCVFRAELMPFAERLVLLALETFADYPEGTNARPGVANLAWLCCCDERTVRRALSDGVELKLIEQTGRANPKRGLASVYRLLPQPVSTGHQSPLETGSEDRFKGTFGTDQVDIPDVSSGHSTGFKWTQESSHQSIDTKTEHQLTNTEIGRAIASDRAHGHEQNEAPYSGEVLVPQQLTYNVWGCHIIGCSTDSYTELGGYCIEHYRYLSRPL